MSLGVTGKQFRERAIASGGFTVPPETRFFEKTGFLNSDFGYTAFWKKTKS